MGRMFEFVVHSTDGVFAVDRRQTIVLWNESATAMLGFQPEEVLGERCYRILRGHDAEGCALCCRGCAAMSAAERLEPAPTTNIVVRNKQGEQVWLNVSTVLVPSQRRGLNVLVHLFRDVTRQHELLRVVMDFAKVVSRLPSGPRVRRSAGGFDSAASVELTRREREILNQLTTGVSTEVIADRLCISRRTVRNHVTNLLAKLGVHSRLEAVTRSIRCGLL